MKKQNKETQGMSDSDDDDVVVLRVCATSGCMSISNLEFDEECNQFYCDKCRELHQRAQVEGYHILLSPEDRAAIRLIFNAFDQERKGIWTVDDFMCYLDAIGGSDTVSLHSSEDLQAYFEEKHEIHLEAVDSNDQCGVTIENLESMYGALAFDDLPALKEDCDILESNGMVNFATLE